MVVREIVKIDGVTDFFYGPQGGRKGTFVINKVGYPIGSFYGYEQDGIFQNQGEVDAHATQEGAAPGFLKFADSDGDGFINLNEYLAGTDPTNGGSLLVVVCRHGAA